MTAPPTDVAARRPLAFLAVAAAGFLLQTIAVTFLTDVSSLSPELATAIAVEIAVLHNFFWHERWTWRDRPAEGRGRLDRFWRFHALNGVVSLVGNLALMRLLVGTLGMPAIPANLLAVIACSVLNYFASDRMVFARDAR